MRPRHAVRRGLSVCAAALLATAAAGCGDDAPPEPTPSTASAPPAPADPRAVLAARAAAAADRRFTAVYTLATQGRDERSVVVTTAADGTWRVDVPGAALGGTADVAIAQIEGGIFQCSLRTDARPVDSTCVKVADQGKKVPNRFDPGVQHVFTDWLDAFTDRQAPIAVSAARRLDGVTGTCFAIESISASLEIPVDTGIYCYSDSGQLTGARAGFGTLRIAAEPVPAPPSIELPGPVVAGEAMGKDAPPPPPEPTAPDPAPSAGATPQA
jgi:hypothetical protein